MQFYVSYRTQASTISRWIYLCSYPGIFPSFHSGTVRGLLCNWSTAEIKPGIQVTSTGTEHSLTFRVLAILSYKRNPCTGCKSTRYCTTAGHHLPFPQLTSGSVQQCGNAARDIQTDRHTDGRGHYTYTSLRLCLTRNVMSAVGEK